MTTSPRFGRRQLLKLGLGVGGAGVVATTGLGWAIFSLRPPASGRAVLSDEDAAFVGAMAEAFFPPNNALGVDTNALDIVSKVDAHLAALLPRERRGAQAVLAAIDWWPRLSLSSTGRFASLSLEDRIAMFDAFDNSSREERRAIPSLLRLMVGIHVFAAPSTLAAMQHRFGCTPATIAAPGDAMAPPGSTDRTNATPAPVEAP